MAVYFFDSSAVVKRYVSEQGSTWVRSVIDPAAGNQIYVSVITGVEVVAALIRRERSGAFDANAATAAISQFRQDWNSYYLRCLIEPSTIERAMSLAEKHRLRAYDAVQLSVALVQADAYRRTGVTVTFVSADDELNTAASTEGFEVQNPQAH